MRYRYICDDCMRAYLKNELEADDTGYEVCPHCGCHTFEVCAVIEEVGPYVGEFDPIDLSKFKPVEKPEEIPGFEKTGDVMRSYKKMTEGWKK